MNVKALTSLIPAYFIALVMLLRGDRGLNNSSFAKNKIRRKKKKDFK
jgi:hypothetical protein